MTLKTKKRSLNFNQKIGKGIDGSRNLFYITNARVSTTY